MGKELRLISVLELNRSAIWGICPLYSQASSKCLFRAPTFKSASIKCMAGVHSSSGELEMGNGQVMRQEREIDFNSNYKIVRL